MTRSRIVILALLTAGPAAAAPPFVFKDVGDEAGLYPHLSGLAGHAAGWGDIDGDGWLDLCVGTFHKPGTKPQVLFRNLKGKFTLDNQAATAISTRATG